MALKMTAKLTSQRGASPALLGLVDTSVVLAYAYGVPPETWHVGTLAFKAALFLAYRPTPRGSYIRAALPFLLLISSLTLISSLAATSDGSGLAKQAGFILHFGLTSALLRRETALAYVRAVAVSIAASAGIHVLLCLSNAIGDHYGRYFYIGDNHPNLGGEINAIGMVAAALTLRRRWVLLSAILIGSSAFLMQSRASLLVVLAASAVVLAFDRRQRITAPRAIGVFAGVLTAAIAAGALGALAGFGDQISRLLLLNDAYRGFGSGFVGRNARWEGAINIIMSHPFFGVGPGYFEQYKLLTPHNFFLFALAENGVFGGGLVIALIAIYLTRCYAKSMFQGCVITCMFILTLFNDRFMSINPYPFIFLLLLVVLSTTTFEKSNRSTSVV
jgi:O-antigen ligase